MGVPVYGQLEIHLPVIPFNWENAVCIFGLKQEQTKATWHDKLYFL